LDRKEVLMIEVPVSNGELLDKIAILEVKYDSGVESVEKELNILLDLVEEQDWWHLPYIYVYYRMLLSINQELWDIEDAKRQCEQQKDFSNKFVQLARAVYIINDERARVKKLINKYSNSELTEYKKHRDY